MSSDFGIYGQNHAAIPLLIYKIILKHYEKLINQLLKQEQIMFCSGTFWKCECENLKKSEANFFQVAVH